jgi:hypothetical protein
MAIIGNASGRLITFLTETKTGNALRAGFCAAATIVCFKHGFSTENIVESTLLDIGGISSMFHSASAIDNITIGMRQRWNESRKRKNIRGNPLRP